MNDMANDINNSIFQEKVEEKKEDDDSAGDTDQVKNKVVNKETAKNPPEEQVIDPNDVSLSQTKEEYKKELDAKYAKQEARDKKKEEAEEKDKKEEEEQEKKYQEKREKDKKEAEDKDKKDAKQRVLEFGKKIKDILTDGGVMIDGEKGKSEDGKEGDQKSGLTKNAQNADRHERTMLGDLFSSLQNDNIINKGADQLKARQSNNTKGKKLDLHYTADQDQKKNKDNTEKRKKENEARDKKIDEENKKRTADLDKRKEEQEKHIKELQEKAKIKRAKKSEESEQEYQDDLQEIDKKYDKMRTEIEQRFNEEKQAMNDIAEVGKAHSKGRSPEEVFSKLSKKGRLEIINQQTDSEEREKLKKKHDEITSIEELPQNLEVKQNETIKPKLNTKTKEPLTDRQKKDLNEQTTKAKAKFDAMISQSQNNTQGTVDHTKTANNRQGIVDHTETTFKSEIKTGQSAKPRTSQDQKNIKSVEEEAVILAQNIPKNQTSSQRNTLQNNVTSNKVLKTNTQYSANK